MLAGEKEANDLALRARCSIVLRPTLPDVLSLSRQSASGTFAVLHEIVWQTAPSPALAKAFPKVRPIEGFEMQVEHAGFEVVERVDATDLEAWLASLGLTNERGAARVCAWLVRRV